MGLNGFFRVGRGIGMGKGEIVARRGQSVWQRWLNLKVVMGFWKKRINLTVWQAHKTEAKANEDYWLARAWIGPTWYAWLRDGVKLGRGRMMGLAIGDAVAKLCIAGEVTETEVSGGLRLESTKKHVKNYLFLFSAV